MKVGMEQAATTRYTQDIIGQAFILNYCSTDPVARAICLHLPKRGALRILGDGDTCGGGIAAFVGN